MKSKIVHSALFGLAVGDALGVPVEFKSRAYLKGNPVLDMMGFGSHNQPKGTWSDDSSLAFCLANSLCKKYNLNDIATKFLKWKKYGSWAAHGKVFDIGMATSESINRFSQGHEPVLCGGIEEKDNGNGSLMRILPLAFYLKKETDINTIYVKVKEVSSITHAHFRSVFACFIYTIYALELLKGSEKFESYNKTKINIENFIFDNNFKLNEIQLFDRVLKANINELSEPEIHSSGYVLHSLEASIWCLLTSNSYEETVLKAVNLGGDTDTTACIAGGLAGLVYGFEAIPSKWIDVLARKEDIMNLCDKLSEKYEI